MLTKAKLTEILIQLTHYRTILIVPGVQIKEFSLDAIHEFLKTESEFRGEFVNHPLTWGHFLFYVLGIIWFTGFFVFA